MKTSEFFGKLFSRYMVAHLLAMTATVVLLAFGVKWGLELYTHHGEGIRVPKLQGMSYKKALAQLDNLGLVIHVSDSGYNKRLPADCILAQTPGPDMMVKEGHIIYVTVNSPASPSFAIPDLVDNSSYREAEAKLMAMGFRLLPPQRIVGEKDWVYGILSHGKRLATGDHVSIDSPLTLVIGNGTYDDDDMDIDVTEPEYQIPPDDIDYGESTQTPDQDKQPAEIDDSGLSDF